MRKPTILFADDEAHLHHNLHQHLHQHGCNVILMLEPGSILRTIEKKNPDLAVLGISNGLHVAKQIRQQYQNLPIILLVRQSSEAQVLDALRAGINDYFPPSFCHTDLTASVKRHLLNNAEKPSAPLVAQDVISELERTMVGQSSTMLKTKTLILNVAATDCTVLITGETGTGKELAAHVIHQYSQRNKKPFHCINCAALPETLIESELFGYDKGAFTGAVSTKMGDFEQANGGTIFLDEIGDMSARTQAKILRTIECKEVAPLGGQKNIALDVRVITATNQNLEQAVEKKLFREDLYYRLNIARIHLPPLRDRKEDIPNLLDHFIQEYNDKFSRTVSGFTSEALELLLQYDWPGNVRELKNLVEATFINLPAQKIRIMDLPELFQKRLKETKDLPKSEREHIITALFATNWNKSKAAEKLNWSRMTLYRKIAKYEIEDERIS